MPNVIQNRSSAGASTTGSQYQEQDHQIAATTAVLNREKEPRSHSIFQNPPPENDLTFF